MLHVTRLSRVAALAAIPISVSAAHADEVRPDQMADLTILEMKAEPAYPHPGEAVRIGLVVRNNAAHDQRDVPLVLYAGRTRASATKLNLGAGETKHIVLKLPAPSGVATLSARIDPDARIPTIDRSDDRAAMMIASTERTRAGADFAVGPISIEVDKTTGARTAHIPVRNSGSAAASGPVEIKVDGKVTDVELVRLAPGKATDVSMVLPDDAAALSASVNPRDKGLERSAANNDAARDLREAVDVRVDQFSASEIASRPGQPRRARVSFRITNRGTADIRQPLPVAIAPASQPDRAARGEVISVGPLAPGQSLSVNRIVELPDGAAEIRVEPDPSHTMLGGNRGWQVLAWPLGPVSQVGQWVSIGPTLINNGGLGAIGRLSAIAMNRADPGTIYVGAAASGVWKSTDGGSSWQPITDGLPTLAIAALAITPTLPSRVYVATAGSGVFRSDDAGASWQSLPGSPNGEVRWGVMIVSPRDPAIVYLNAVNGVFRSTDSGGTWTRVLSSGEVTDLIMAQGTPTTLFAAVAGDGVYKTVDGGNTWARTSTGLPTPNPGFQITLASPRNVPATLYAAVNMPGGLQLFRTDDGGASWTQKNTPADTQLYNDDIGADPVDPNIVYVTGVRIWRSTDGGNTFGVLSGPHADHHAFYNDPVSDTTIYALSDGGIFKSVNRGQSWTFIGSGIANVEFYDHGLAASDPTLTFGGTQDNGTLKYSGSATWTAILGGDGATVAIDPTDPNIIYAMNQGADSVQRTSNGSSFQAFANGLPAGAVCNNLLFSLHPRTRTTLVAPCLALWRTTTTTPPGDWQQILAQPATGTIVRAAVDRSSDLYYAGTSDGKILAGPGGGSWRQVFAHPTAAGVTDIDVDPANPRRLFVSFAASGSERIYMLTRASSAPTSMAAQAIGNGLPSGLTVQSLAVDPSLNFTAYAATNKGVYRGRAASATGTWFWSLFSNGMPLADARDLEVHPTTGVLHLATYGRSAYEMNTAPPFGSVLNAQGRITMLRAHDVGSGYGPPNDFLDVETVLWLDSMPGNSFGFQLRTDANMAARRGMFSLLRKAFTANRRISIDYVRTGLRSGRIIRVMLIP